MPHKKALVAAETGKIVGIVGAGYKVFTNQQAVTLCHSDLTVSHPHCHAPFTQPQVAARRHFYARGNRG